MTSEITIFADTKQEFHESGTIAFSIRELGSHVIRKALNKIDFYRFFNLKSFFPNLRSVAEFIASEKYLGGLTVELAGLKYKVKDFPADNKLDIAVDVLQQLSLHIESKTTEYVGTKVFFPQSVSAVAKDKQLNIVLDAASDQEFGREMSQPANRELYLNLKEKPWYVYEENYGTSEEKFFIKFINTAIDALRQRYTEVYLLRNESVFQLYRFSDGAAIEPDFVLFLRKDGEKKYLMYQLFVEAKGDRGLIEDKWKEEFLLEIEKQYKIDVLFENRDFKLVGMPFYNENIKSEFEKVFIQKVVQE